MQCHRLYDVQCLCDIWYVWWIFVNNTRSIDFYYYTIIPIVFLISVSKTFCHFGPLNNPLRSMSAGLSQKENMWRLLKSYRIRGTESCPASQSLTSQGHIHFTWNRDTDKWFIRLMIVLCLKTMLFVRFLKCIFYISNRNSPIALSIQAASDSFIACFLFDKFSLTLNE